MVLILILLAIVVFRAIEARSLPDLEVWHRISVPTDPLLDNPPEDFSLYLEKEQMYIEELFAMINDQHPNAHNKYDPQHVSHRAYQQQNFNGSFELIPEQPAKGGILLLHGLSDSPYHLRSIARLFQEQGYRVVCLRLPGHGTVPSALKDIHWRDWVEAVDYGVNTLREELGDLPFFMGGFSTGGALSVHYSLRQALDQADLMPEKVFLFAPAMGVSAAASFADWHYTLSWLPFFEKFQWTDVEPEYDPYKYNSFPKNAADQIYDLTQENLKLIKQVQKRYPDRSQLPSFYSFISIADATVSPQALMDMYAAIGSEESELMLFDVNRLQPEFFQSEYAQLEVEKITQMKGWQSTLNVLANLPNDTLADAYLAEATIWDTQNGQLQAVSGADTISWPPFHFALSHVCIPISTEDEIYGQDGWLGSLNAKGERGVLTFSSNNLIRIRYNPFYSLMEKRIVSLIQ